MVKLLAFGVAFLAQKHISTTIQDKRQNYNIQYTLITMLFKGIVALAALAITTLTTPVNIISLPQSQSLSKRATPDFKKGDYTKQQIAHIKQGHADAIKMASTAVIWSKSSERFDPIFKKYFNIQDRNAVVGKDCPWSWICGLKSTC